MELKHIRTKRKRTCFCSLQILFFAKQSRKNRSESFPLKVKFLTHVLGCLAVFPLEIKDCCKKFLSSKLDFLSQDRSRSLHGVAPLIWSETFASGERNWSSLGKNSWLNETFSSPTHLQQDPSSRSLFLNQNVYTTIQLFCS